MPQPINEYTIFFRHEGRDLKFVKEGHYYEFAYDKLMQAYPKAQITSAVSKRV